MDSESENQHNELGAVALIAASTIFDDLVDRGLVRTDNKKAALDFAMFLGSEIANQTVNGKSF